MKYRIRATLDKETFEFNIYDNVKWLTLLYKTGGITLGKNTVLLKYSLATFNYLNPHIVGHETIHIRQAHRMGWKYLLTYVKQMFQARFVKRNIPMEQEAYSEQHLVNWEIIK